MSAPAGQFVGLNLGPRYTGDARFLPLNLGVEWSDVPEEPPEPAPRGLRSSASMPWRRASRLARVASLLWGTAPGVTVDVQAPWGRASKRQRALSIDWDAAERTRRGLGLPWRGELSQGRQACRLTWSVAPRTAGDTSMSWRTQGAVRRGVDVTWRSLDSVMRAWRLPWQVPTEFVRASRGMRWFHPGQARRGWRIPWGPARRVPWLVLPPKPPEPPVDPETSERDPRHVVLNLACATSTVPGVVALNLGVIACYAIRPQRRTYTVRNSLTVVRLPDRTPIEVDAVSIASSVDAWGHSIDMTLSSPQDLPLLKPNASGPRQVEITINGYVWTGLVEGYSRTRAIDNEGRPVFGAQVTGRSRTALLAAPYAPARTKVSALALNAAQLVDEELTDTGFAADFGTVDWLVPAGAWYYDGLSPLEAITRVAEAAGAVVQSDPETLALRVLPRYPASPWDWLDTEPDHQLQDDVVTSDSLQVRSAPTYDAVVVTGEIAGKGVTATVRRTGEAGTLYAPQASSPLINTDAVAGERGRNVLSDRGEQAAIDLTFPLFPTPVATGETGRVLPLDLVRVTESEATWHGLCTAVRIAASRDNGALLVEQSITLERHFTDAD